MTRGSKFEVFKKMKETGFVGAGLSAGKGKGKRHRFDLSKLVAKKKKDPLFGDTNREEKASEAKPTVKKLDPHAEDAGVLSDAPVVKKVKPAAKKISVNVSDDLFGEMKKMNPKRVGRK